MTQRIIDNAGAISLDRDLTAAQTVSQSRQLKWFRKGPIQTIAEVQLNVIVPETYRLIRAELSGSLIGPYNLTFPSVVVGDPITASVRPTTGNQTGDSVAVTGPATTTPILAGSIIQFPNHTQTYVATADVALDGVGEGVINLDQPLFRAPSTSLDIRVGSDIVFRMNLLNRPRASFGPTGLVNHDGAFLFSEDY